MNFKVAFIALLMAIGTHYTAYWYGSKKPAQIIEKEVVRKDVQTIIKEIIRPDGSKEIQTIIVDKSKESSTVKIPVFQPPKDWVVGAYYRVNDPTYALSVSRRILGPFSASAFGDLKGNIYLGATIEF
jgi:hypothetical protein